MATNISELDIFIGEKIRYFRRQRGWNLKLLASKLNISIQQFQKYETSVNKISASLLFEIAAIFNISMDHFFQGFNQEVMMNPTIKNSFNVLLISNDINDEFVIRQATSNLSSKINLYVIHDPSKALEFLKKLNNNEPFGEFIKPDIVIIELHLAKISGLDILKMIKKDRKFHSIPVIIITNSSTKDEISLSYTYNVGGLIIKSACYKEFQEQIHTALCYWTELVNLPTNP